jgi:hypothetical protein
MPLGGTFLGGILLTSRNSWTVHLVKLFQNNDLVQTVEEAPGCAMELQLLLVVSVETALA